MHILESLNLIFNFIFLRARGYAGGHTGGREGTERLNLKGRAIPLFGEELEQLEHHHTLPMGV